MRDNVNTTNDRCVNDLEMCVADALLYASESESNDRLEVQRVLFRRVARHLSADRAILLCDNALECDSLGVKTFYCRDTEKVRSKVRDACSRSGRAVACFRSRETNKCDPFAGVFSTDQDVLAISANEYGTCIAVAAFAFGRGTAICEEGKGHLCRIVTILASLGIRHQPSLRRCSGGSSSQSNRADDTLFPTGPFS